MVIKNKIELDTSEMDTALKTTTENVERLVEVLKEVDELISKIGHGSVSTDEAVKLIADNAVKLTAKQFSEAFEQSSYKHKEYPSEEPILAFEKRLNDKLKSDLAELGCAIECDTPHPLTVNIVIKHKINTAEVMKSIRNLFPLNILVAVRLYDEPIYQRKYVTF